ncbi:hypothetical protein [Acetobacter thailandicus]|uniref:hypothetical protein n=1 Tax=Acetobacter thailandicus TaxID=1502842 RepID=UPI001BAD83D0|nr:hypothetical protein [Acetobacter thailandicus]MBS0980969.1 hypothetical protein [Acetobacter thailandicus]
MNFLIKNWAKGNPGNIMMMYISSLKLKKKLGFGSISNISIPIFNIDLPEIDIGNVAGIHDYMNTNNKQSGFIPMDGIKYICENTDSNFVSLEGNSQNIKNFFSIDEFDYENEFPFMKDNNCGGGDDDLVINIRGGEILSGIHPDYCLIPPEFYEYIINISGKKPIFYGQLDESPYLKELIERFPDAEFINSRGVKEDFDFIRRSKHIVPCLSTFSWMASWLSHAEKIYFPVAGVLNPFQHRSSMLLPFNDKRYQFFLFPIYTSLHVDNYKKYIDPIRNSWRHISHKNLEMIIPKIKEEISDYIIGLDIFDYVNNNKGAEIAYNSFRELGVYNHYMSHGFFHDNYKKKINIGEYINKNKNFSLELISGEYEDVYDHYVKVGQYIK